MTKQQDYSANVQSSLDKDVAGIRDADAEVNKNEAVNSMNEKPEGSESKAPASAKQVLSEMSQASKIAKKIMSA